MGKLWAVSAECISENPLKANPVPLNQPLAKRPAALSWRLGPRQLPGEQAAQCKATRGVERKTFSFDADERRASKAGDPSPERCRESLQARLHFAHGKKILDLLQQVEESSSTVL